MSCRCDEIEMMQQDLACLEEAMNTAAVLQGTTGMVRDKLVSLASEYENTVNAQENFIMGFDKLDEDADIQVKMIMDKLENAREELICMLEMAICEDMEYHKVHKKKKHKKTKVIRERIISAEMYPISHINTMNGGVLSNVSE